MRRYTMTLGSPTTAGGKVITASSAISINGAKVALEGDSVSCPVCKSEGKIRCDGPRLREFFGEKKVALDGDLCMCGCPTPPRLIATQTLRSQILDGEEAEQWARELEAAKAVHAMPGGSAHRGHAAFVDERSNRPVESASYTLASKQGAMTDVNDTKGRGSL